MRHIANMVDEIALTPISSQLDQHTREEHASRLGLSLADFDRLVTSGNRAYEIVKALGPFYGREDTKEPTFRITAEPVILPLYFKETLAQLGDDILHLAKALQQLPEDVKRLIGTDLDFAIPFTWRVDAIVDEYGGIKINEIEGKDGANALMIAEQIAYDLQTLDQSTATQFIKAVKVICASRMNGSLKIAHIRTDNACSPNANRFISFVRELSDGYVQMDHLIEDAIRNGGLKPDWASYAGVINDGSFTPYELINFGIVKEQIIASGNYNAIVNKGVLAILFQETQETFWIDTLGKDRLARLKDVLIPAKFITSEYDIELARKKGQVVKVSWAGQNEHLINRSNGVAMPMGDLKHATDERWNTLKDLLKQDVKMIAQDFVMPKKIRAFLRKKGTSLEPVEWYNRLCVKYVVAGDPNHGDMPPVMMTAAEVTLGPDIIPAGRACAFTAASFV